MEQKDKKPIIRNILTVLTALVLLVSLGINVYVGIGLFKEAREKKNDSVEASNTITDNEKQYSSKEVAALFDEAMNKGYEDGKEDLKLFIKESLLDNNSSNHTFRKIFDDYIVYIHDGEFVFKDINTELTPNTLEKEDYENAYKGIDVSKFQGDIDWKLVAEDGIDFVFVRAGFRGYETGAVVEDEKARYNIEEALKNGIKTGVYFYTQAITEEEAIEEAEFVLDMIKDYDINYPVAFDMEVVDDEVARTNSLTTEERTKIVKAFCDTIKEAGYTPMLYGNLATMFSLVEYEEVLEYEKWFAYYDEELYYPYDLAIWQYSYTGEVAGIEALCDLNLAFKDLTTIP